MVDFASNILGLRRFYVLGNRANFEYELSKRENISSGHEKCLKIRNKGRIYPNKIQNNQISINLEKMAWSINRNWNNRIRQHQV